MLFWPVFGGPGWPYFSAIYSAIFSGTLAGQGTLAGLGTLATYPPTYLPTYLPTSLPTYLPTYLDFMDGVMENLRICQKDARGSVSPLRVRIKRVSALRTRFALVFGDSLISVTEEGFLE